MIKQSFDENEARELYSQGLRDAEIADRLKVRSTAIGSWRYRRGLPANLPPLKSGTRPEVTVDIPPDLAASKSAPEPSPPVDGGAADSQQEDRQNLPPLPAARGSYKHKLQCRRLFCRLKCAELRTCSGGGGIAPGGSQGGGGCAQNGHK